MTSQSNESAQVATQIRRSVTRLARRLRSERAGHGLPAAMLSVLGHLLRAGTLTASALAALEQVQPQSLTRILAELDAAGLITRAQAETDRRQIQIEISQSGRALMAQDAHRQDALLARIMAANLTEAECDMIAIAARLLDRLCDAAQDGPPTHRHTYDSVGETALMAALCGKAVPDGL